MCFNQASELKCGLTHIGNQKFPQKHVFKLPQTESSRGLISNTTSRQSSIKLTATSFRGSNDLVIIQWQIFPGINKISYTLFRYLPDGFLCWMLLGEKRRKFYIRGGQLIYFMLRLTQLPMKRVGHLSKTMVLTQSHMVMITYKTYGCVSYD